MKNGVILLLILALQLPQIMGYAIFFEMVEHLQQHSNEMIDSEDHDVAMKHSHKHNHNLDDTEHEHKHSHPPLKAASVDAQFLGPNSNYLFALQLSTSIAPSNKDKLTLSQFIFEIFRPPIS